MPPAPPLLFCRPAPRRRARGLLTGAGGAEKGGDTPQKDLPAREKTPTCPDRYHSRTDWQDGPAGSQGLYGSPGVSRAAGRHWCVHKTSCACSLAPRCFSVLRLALTAVRVVCCRPSWHPRSARHPRPARRTGSRARMRVPSGARPHLLTIWSLPSYAFRVTGQGFLLHRRRMPTVHERVV